MGLQMVLVINWGVRVLNISLMLTWLSLAIIIAQTGGDGVSGLYAYGPMGAVLAWFMFRSERAMNRLSHKIDGMTRAILVDTLSRDNCGPATRKLAQQMLDKSTLADTKD